MSTEHPSRWRQILILGERLQEISISAAAGQGDDSSPHSAATDAVTVLNAQQNEIISQTGQLLACQTKLWLSEGLLPSRTWHPDQGSEQRGLGDLCTPVMLAAYQTGQIRCVEEANDPDVFSGPECQETRSQYPIVAVPILSQALSSEILGVLQVERLPGTGFTPDDIALLEGIASQVGIGLQAARRLASERWRVEQLALVQHVSTQIVNVRDLEELTRTLTSLIQSTFGYYYVAIFTVEPGQESLNFQASSGGEPHPGSSVRRPTSEPLFVHVGKGLIGQVAQTGQEIVANDVTQEPRFLDSDLLPDTRAEASFPLKIEDRVVGVLDVQSDYPGAFQEVDMLVLRALAGNIAIA
ncbi:MAG TPA: GAF domain-containing protein, partial [Anaerolineales bacterium]|nr:GAF domain-containing protein [Anaerolineales bacterium]